MIVLCVLLGIAALLALICCVPVSVTAEYSSQGASIIARAGPLRIPLYPRSGTEARQDGKKQAKKKKVKKQRSSKTGEKQTEPTQKAPAGGRLPMFRELLGLALEAQAALRNRLRIREMTLHLTVGGKGDDPARAAILCGGAWSAIGALWPQLERAFRIENRDVQVGVDFLEEENRIYARATAAIAVGTVLRLGGYYGIKGLTIYQKHTKKGGSENGTSNQ